MRTCRMVFVNEHVYQFMYILFSLFHSYFSLFYSLVPPKKLNIIDDKGVEMSSPLNVIGPYNEGSTISIGCIAYGGEYV